MPTHTKWVTYYIVLDLKSIPQWIKENKTVEIQTMTVDPWTEEKPWDNAHIFYSDYEEGLNVNR